MALKALNCAWYSRRYMNMDVAGSSEPRRGDQPVGFSAAGPISRENGPRTLRDLVTAFSRRTTGERLTTLGALIRGLLLWPRLGRSTWLLAERRVHVRRRYGHVELGRFTRLGEGCRIAVVGAASQDAVLRIGEFTSIGPRTIINVSDRVDIGRRCLVAWDCDIMDTDFHTIQPLEDEPSQPGAKPVTIEDDVWIGARAIVLKGVHIGSNSVVGAGSVVSGYVPANSLVAGNPARVIRTINGWRR
jgi:acetyltransferase-like isoleucine patch superfamily enzyme